MNNEDIYRAVSEFYLKFAAPHVASFSPRSREKIIDGMVADPEFIDAINELIGHIRGY